MICVTGTNGCMQHSSVNTFCTQPHPGHSLYSQVCS